jgi:O-antigen biosynthesis protein
MLSGVRCLHLLCHHLNRLGYRSYVGTQVANPNLDTPFADAEMIDKFERNGLRSIVIYPDIVAGNPLHAKRIVRYLLNRPGYFTGVGAETYGEGDFFLHYANEFRPAGLQSQQLRIPLVDQEIYRLPEQPIMRDTFAVYTARHPLDAASFPSWITKPEIISSGAPRSPRSLASLYQRSRALITGERTAACLEAMHCGCPVIIVPNESFNHKPVVEFYDGCGFCIGFDRDGLEHATHTTALALRKYQARLRGLDGSIEDFVENACRYFGL